MTDPRPADRAHVGGAGIMMPEPPMTELAQAVERALVAIGQAREAYDAATAAVRREHSPDADSHQRAAIGTCGS